jgi:hypothetical protein
LTVAAIAALHLAPGMSTVLRMVLGAQGGSTQRVNLAHFATVVRLLAPSAVLSCSEDLLTMIVPASRERLYVQTAPLKPDQLRGLGFIVMCVDERQFMSAAMDEQINIVSGTGDRVVMSTTTPGSNIVLHLQNMRRNSQVLHVSCAVNTR